MIAKFLTQKGSQLQRASSHKASVQIVTLPRDLACHSSTMTNPMLKFLLLLSTFLVVVAGSGAKKGAKGLSSWSESPSITPTRFVPPKMKTGHAGNPAPLIVPSPSWLPSDAPSLTPSISPSGGTLSASDAPSLVPSSSPSCHRKGKGKKGKGKSKKEAKKKGPADYDPLKTKGSKKGIIKSAKKTGKSKKQLECQDEDDDVGDGNSTAGQQYAASGDSLSTQQSAVSGQQNSPSSDTCPARTGFVAIVMAGIVAAAMHV